MMNESKFLTVQLQDQDYDRLANEAKRLNLPLDILVQRLLQLSLEKIPATILDKQKAKDMIASLRKIAQNLPAVDAVAITRQSREDLEERCIPHSAGLSRKLCQGPIREVNVPQTQ